MKMYYTGFYEIIKTLLLQVPNVKMLQKLFIYCDDSV